MDKICIRKFTKKHNSVKGVEGDRVLVLCTSPDNAIYFSQVLRMYLKGFQSYRFKQ